ncbi:gag-pol polyprotein [Tanacetum coccineum]
MATVRFKNDYFAAITGYGDYVQGNLTICHVYYVEGLGHNLFLVGQFFDGDLKVAFRSNTCYVRKLEGADLLTGSRDSNLYIISISELVASSLNRSIVHTRYNKTPYELIRGRKPNIQYFHVFGSLCYPINDHDDLRKMKPKADIGIFIGYSESSRGFYSSEDSQSVPSKTDLDNLFGPLYEEYYATSTPEVLDNFAANILDIEDSPSSSSIVVEEDEAPQIVSSSAELVSTKPNTPVSNDPLNMHEFQQTHRSTDKWTKNHLIEQVIGDPSKPVTTRRRLHTYAEVCMYALTLSTTKPKNIKDAMLDHSWFESMQDELNQFKRLDVWKLVE